MHRQVQSAVNGGATVFRQSSQRFPPQQDTSSVLTGFAIQSPTGAQQSNAFTQSFSRPGSSAAANAAPAAAAANAEQPFQFSPTPAAFNSGTPVRSHFAFSGIELLTDCIELFDKMRTNCLLYVQLNLRPTW